MGSDKLKCDLCGSEIIKEPVHHTIDGEDKVFCCNGCARVYSEAYQKGILDQVLTEKAHKKNKLSAKNETVHFSIGGMYCSGCALAAENVLQNQPGMISTEISFAAEKGRLVFDPTLGNPSEALKTLDGLGYHARLSTDREDINSQNQDENTLLQLLVAIGFGMQIMLIYLVQLYPRYLQGDFNALDLRKLQYLIWALVTPVLFYGGSSYLRGAWRALRARTATMDTLVAMGTLSAYSYSAYIALTGNGEVYFDSIVMITVFIMLGRYLERIGGTQARKDIQSLLKLQPEQAHRKTDGEWENVPVSKLKLDDLLLIKPGERIPADGEITEGEASINESLLTGESLPVTRQKGDHIFAGTLVEDSPIQMRVTRELEKSRLSQIAQLVEDTLSQKPPIQRLADKAAAIFAFLIIGVAVLTAGVRLLLGQPANHALLTAVSVLVVACPCALGLATPMALVVTLGRATREGLIVRNQAAMETSSRINEVVFDKTGTLTLGKLSIVTIVLDKTLKISADELINLSASVEQFSEHPIAVAITSGQTHLTEPENFKVVKGFGTQGEIKGQLIKVGSIKYFANPPAHELLEKSEENAAMGHTVVWIGWDETPYAFITLSDQPNPTAIEAISQLEKLGIKVSMLSGDTQTTSQVIAKSLGLDSFSGFCPPEKKAELIKEKQNGGQKIAMVGDGVNDAPALAQSDLSFTAFGGTDIAGETSDVILTKSDLRLVPWFVKLSALSRRVIIENLAWAFAYNLVSVPLAALGVISPVIAAGTMATSSLLVVGNSLRLRRKKISFE